MHSFPIGILGASGYAGRELATLVAAHPALHLAFATANGRAGSRVSVAGRTVDLIATEDAPLADAALIFSALPHGTSSAWVERARTAGAKVVDLSADLRPGSGAITDITYGLTELRRDDVRRSSVVANPGCYPTGILLALAPLLARELVLPATTIQVTAASGVTGAGYAPRPELLFAEVAEDFRPYASGNSHRHLPEMLAMLASFSADNDLVFMPHLLPVARGILATITVSLVRSLADPLSPWREHYSNEPFIEITEEPPALRDVVRRNVVRISAAHAMHVRSPMLIVTAAIDNLMKGAAGQAVQNANLMLGLPEPMGLPA
ncbi:MAG: N-acetyl-gamma-glutamyl-phosphate reductase [Gemmatimonadaceae bacterium]